MRRCRLPPKAPHLRALRRHFACFFSFPLFPPRERLIVRTRRPAAGPEDVANGSVLGTKRAAIRKLEHELGIPPSQLPIDSFRFLTRLHYCAADADPSRPDR